VNQRSIAKLVNPLGKMAKTSLIDLAGRNSTWCRKGQDPERNRKAGRLHGERPRERTRAYVDEETNIHYRREGCAPTVQKTKTKLGRRPCRDTTETGKRPCTTLQRAEEMRRVGVKRGKAVDKMPLSRYIKAHTQHICGITSIQTATMMSSLILT
jgi:hypothetical protein